MLLIFKFYERNGKNLLEFAHIRWYEENDELWGCLRLRLIKHYSCISIESINKTVHIVPRFEKTNEYLVNIFIF